MIYICKIYTIHMSEQNESYTVGKLGIRIPPAYKTWLESESEKEGHKQQVISNAFILAALELVKSGQLDWHAHFFEGSKIKYTQERKKKN